jgi:nitroreductase
MRRLDPDRAVSDEDVLTVVEAATKAATGGNSQPVRWLVVRDADKRRRLGEIYRECWLPVRKMYESVEQQPDTRRVLSSADHLGDHMGEAPVIILPCSKGPTGQAESSVYPGVQNLFLAARALGLGTTLTTVHRLQEDDVRAVLDIPEDVNTWAMIPMGYPTGRWGEAKRRPVREVTYWDSWRNPPPA